MTQISNMKVIGLMVDFLKIVQFWRLSTGVWQLFAWNELAQWILVSSRLLPTVHEVVPWDSSQMTLQLTL